MPYVSEPDQKHYLLHYLSLVDEVGKLGNLLHINSHVFNSVSPSDLDAQLARIEAQVARIRTKYPQQYQNAEPSLEH